MPRIENLSNEVDTKTLILFWEFSIEIINEINLVTNQHLSVEMFLIRLLYVKKKNTNSEINNNEFDNNSDNQNKKLVDDIRSSKSDLINKNKTIDQIKFSSQEKQKLLIENEKKINKTKVNSLADLISICTEKKEIELKYELENNVNLISFQNKTNNLFIKFNFNNL